jgi:hypothetical protein
MDRSSEEGKSHLSLRCGLTRHEVHRESFSLRSADGSEIAIAQLYVVITLTCLPSLSHENIAASHSVGRLTSDMADMHTQHSVDDVASLDRLGSHDRWSPSGVSAAGSNTRGMVATWSGSVCYYGNRSSVICRAQCPRPLTNSLRAPRVYTQQHIQVISQTEPIGRINQYQRIALHYVRRKTLHHQHRHVQARPIQGQGALLHRR